MKTEILTPHPLNRHFPTRGPEWAEFLESVKRPYKIHVPLLVRIFGEGYQVLAGHRRLEAARLCGIDDVPVTEVDMDDQEALEFLINENMQRLDLSPRDEAMFVAAMHRELGLADEEVALRLSRSEHWVRTRQLLMDLGEEVLERVSLRPGDPRFVSVRAIEVVATVPSELRAEAIQMVLHPELQESALNERQAKDVISACLIEPWKRKREWTEAKDRLLKEGKKMIKAAGLPADMLVRVAAFDDVATERRGTVDAFSPVAEACLTEAAPRGLIWAQLAHRCGLPIVILPPQNGGDEAELCVSSALIWQAETARAEYHEAPWIREPGKIHPPAPPEDEGGDVDDDEDQPVEAMRGNVKTYANLETTEIRRIGKLATCLENDPTQEVPEWAPPWVHEVWNQCGGTVLADIAEWIMSQRA